MTPVRNSSKAASQASEGLSNSGSVPAVSGASALGRKKARQRLFSATRDSDERLAEIGAAHLQRIVIAGRLGLALTLLEPERKNRWHGRSPIDNSSVSRDLRRSAGDILRPTVSRSRYFIGKRPSLPASLGMAFAKQRRPKQPRSAAVEITDDSVPTTGGRRRVQLHPTTTDQNHLRCTCLRSRQGQRTHRHALARGCALASPKQPRRQGVHAADSGWPPVAIALCLWPARGGRSVWLRRRPAGTTVHSLAYASRNGVALCPGAVRSLSDHCLGRRANVLEARREMKHPSVCFCNNPHSRCDFRFG